MVFAFSNLDFLVNYLKSCQKSHHVVACRRDASGAVAVQSQALANIWGVALFFVQRHFLQ